MRTILAALAAFASLAYADARNAPSVLEGTAHVKDGDGIGIGDVPDIRLQGIAAPEYRKNKREPGGLESTNHLRDYVEGKFVRCELDGTIAGRVWPGQKPRPAGICYLGNKDLGLYQVEGGHARDCPRNSKGRYAEAERKARAKRDLSAIYPLPSYCGPP